MTTIACDGKTVAADDRLVNDRGRICVYPEPKLRIVPEPRGDLIVGVSGTMVDALFEWWFDGADPSKKPATDGWALVVFRPTFLECYTHECPYPQRDGYPAAVGSGAGLALGAMLAGKTAREAVEIAAMRDVYTGGIITELPLQKPAPLDAVVRASLARDLAMALTNGGHP
jgi:hypothetical protein